MSRRTALLKRMHGAHPGRHLQMLFRNVVRHVNDIIVAVKIAPIHGRDAPFCFSAQPQRTGVRKPMPHQVRKAYWNDPAVEVYL